MPMVAIDMARKNTGKPAGKPPYKPTDDDRRTVELMTAIGTSQENVARCVGDGIDLKTLRKYYREELDTAVIKANAKVGGSMFNKAIAGDVSAQKYWMGCRAGWKETSVTETPDGPPSFNIIMVPSPKADK